MIKRTAQGKNLKKKINSSIMLFVISTIPILSVLLMPGCGGSDEEKIVSECRQGDRTVDCIEITVSSGLNPVYSFSGGDIHALAVYPGNDNSGAAVWQIACEAGFPSPVTHGITPEGAVEMTGTERTLTSGSQYTVAVIRGGLTDEAVTANGLKTFTASGSPSEEIVSWADPVTVDSEGNVGEYSSIAIDGQDKIHIAYYEGFPEYDLKYATNSSGSWICSTLDSAGSIGEYSSLAVDSQDHIHISYYDILNGDLKYATNSSGSWVCSTLDSADNVGEFSSIAADSQNYIHISYYDITNGNLKYATNSSGSWVYSNPDETDDTGMHSSIAVDSGDKVHIAYYSTTDSEVKYITNAAGSWIASTIDNPDINPYDTNISIAADSGDKIHISYQDNGNDDLKYATNVTGSWVKTAIDSYGLVGKMSSIAAYAGYIHISYFSQNYGDLYYITNSNGYWSSVLLDEGDGGNTGQYTSIAVDSEGNIHISYYYDSDNNSDNVCDLRYIHSAQ